MTEENKYKPRAETGPCQFDDDWPGIFIRGDEAAGIIMELSKIQSFLDKYETELNQHVGPFHSGSLKGLMKLLGTCHFNQMDSEKIIECERIVKSSK